MRACVAILLLFPSLVLADPPPVPELRVASASGDSSIELHLAAQMQWTGTRRDTGDNAVGEFSLAFRRLRPVVRGHLLGEDLSYLLHLSTLPGAMELMDLWVGYRFTDRARVRVGQMKIPFTRWRTNSYQTRPSVDWSYGSKFFGGERQLGVMLHNGAAAGFEYQIGIFDGVNARGVHGIGTALVYHEPTPNYSNLVERVSGRDVRAEGVFHVAYNAGGIDVSRPTDFDGGALRWSAGLSGAWDIDPAPKRDMRMRIAPEAELKWHHFAVTGLLYLGFFDPVMTDGSHQLGLVGGLVQSSYLLTDTFELALKVTTMHALSRLRSDARNSANAVIAASGPADNLEVQYAGTGHVRSENEVDVTFNTYLVGGVLKLQVEGAWLLHERLSDNRYDWALRVQGQLAF